MFDRGSLSISGCYCRDWSEDFLTEDSVFRDGTIGLMGQSK